MANGFNWEITLADDSVKKQADGDMFSLSWETDNAVKSIKLVGTGTITDNYEVVFSSGKFYKNGVEIDAGIGTGLNLVWRTRNQIRMDETGPLPLGTAYIAGYKIANADMMAIMLSPQYTLGQEEPTSFDRTYIDHL
jgi:hypothetical protein